MKIIIAYCTDNQYVAAKIATALSSQVEVVKVGFDYSNTFSSLSKHITDNQYPVLLLVSDNFLKSKYCMSDALGIVQMLGAAKRLIPVTTDGIYQGPGQEIIRVATSFDRVSNVIQYMNYWQDTYLELRRTKKDNTETSSEEEIRMVRTISSEVGELLRYMRAIEYFSYDQFEDSNFIILYRILGLNPPNGPVIANSAPQVVSTTYPPEVSFVAPAPIEEKELELPPVDLNAIPGMGLLQNTPPPAEPTVDKAHIDALINHGVDKPSTLESLIDSMKTPEAAPPMVNDQLNAIVDEVVSENDAAVDALLESHKTQEPLAAAPEAEDLVQKILAEAAATPEPEGLEEIAAALIQQPGDTALRYAYAAQLAQAGQLQDASEQLEILLEIDRTNIDAYMLQAYIGEQNSDYLLSLSCLEKVTLLKADYPGIYYRLGMLVNTHFKTQKRKALKYFKEAIGQDPANADAHYQYALLTLELSGDYAVAIEHLLAAGAEGSQHHQAIFELAKAYYELGDAKNAAHHYQRAVALNPGLKTPSNDAIFTYEAPEPEVPRRDNGKVVLITGATSGIGKATAALFSDQGYRVIITGRRADRLEALKAEFETAYHNHVHCLNFDVRSQEAVQEAINSLDAPWQNVDILINNAGGAMGLDPIHEGALADWEMMIDTNVKGLLYMTRALAPHMVARRSGFIINIGSIAGKEIYPNGNVYNAVKHAVDALTRAMRVDLHKYNIRVAQIAPGAVEETEFSLVRFKGDAEKAKIYEDFKPLNAQDIADAIYYVATRPEHVNIQDMLIMATQQASANHFDKSGRSDR